MKNLKFLVAAVALVALSGCAAVPYQSGILYSDLAGPVNLTANAVGAKTGEACMSNILGIVATGDASTAAAAQNGQITEIATVDVKYTSILGLFSKSCTTVTGQ